MAKKENGNATKSFILRVDAEMMEAIEAWAADDRGGGGGVGCR